VIPESVTEICESAFEGCINLKEVTISEGVQIIGKAAFRGCSNLQRIKFPSSVKRIDVLIFEGCTNLHEIIVDSKNHIYKSNSDHNAIIQSKENKLVAVSNKCDYVPEVSVIGAYVYMNRKDLTQIKIPMGIIEVEDGAFCNCTGLTQIEMPISLEIIGAQAFYNCCNITSLEIPANVTSIGDCAFYRCFKLQIMIVHPTIPPEVTGSLGCAPLNGARVPVQSTEAYKRANGWSVIEIPYAYIP
jgi:hypothetical protein